MPKVDPKQEWKALYQPKSPEPLVVEVPEFRFLMVDGAGDPNTSRSYAEAVEALFSVSYAAKFQIKKGQGVDYAVMPLEGLWWTEDMAAFSVERKHEWRWTLMIMQPEWVTRGLIQAALAEAARKKALPGLSRLRFSAFAEGRCVQLLHVGSFAEEGPAIGRLHRCADSISFRRGKHHEIYLSDIRRCAPAKWRTIIRQPIG
ncbi:MAG TPA: GyrI-like domain-containing protein [Geothrix sp.]|nr:GyrI-like domain-containing protein [Geothrix sp.]